MAGVLFLFSLLVILGSLAAAVWLCTTRQVFSFDGLFLFLSSLVVLLSFSLYVRFMLRNALNELKQSTTGAKAPKSRVSQTGQAQAKNLTAA
jgi:hypothetical protein